MYLTQVWCLASVEVQNEYPAHIKTGQFNKYGQVMLNMRSD